MTGNILIQAAVFLAAAAIAAPIAKKLNISSVLGYLAAGVLIGPFGLGFVYEVYQVESILHIAEYGVALLLFLIGLELKPKRLWAMRKAVFGLGLSQVLVSAALLAPLIILAGVAVLPAIFIAFALSLSSTAFVLQVLEEKGELKTRHGRSAFSILLFQDLAAIPLIALVPLFAAGGLSQGFSWLSLVKGLAAIAVVLFLGRFVLSTLYRLVASTGVREAMTASALLTVVGVILLMEAAGLSAALGAFLAGALLADSAYRHQIEADIAPFEGLLLGLFFTSVGMALNLQVLSGDPMMIALAVAVLLAVKGGVLFFLGRWFGLETVAARRLALAVSQGGEFAFVLSAAALSQNVISKELSEVLTVVVTLSMLATPILLIIDEKFLSKSTKPPRAFDEMPDEQGHVIIAGFGRFGQIVARILRARGIPFTALDDSADQVDLVSRFGNTAYYGDAGRLDILESAQMSKARAFVLAIDEVEGSVRTAEVVRQHFPHVPIFARARNRQHVHRLMDLDVKVIRRETFLSAVDLTRSLLRTLDVPETESRRTIDLFETLDRRRLYDDYAHYTDMEKLQARAQQQSEELEDLFERDVQELDAALPDHK